MTSKQIDKAIEQAFSIHFNRVQLPIMDISKIFREARSVFAAADNKRSMDEVVELISRKYKGVANGINLSN